MPNAWKTRSHPVYLLARSQTPEKSWDRVKDFCFIQAMVSVRVVVYIFFVLKHSKKSYVFDICFCFLGLIARKLGMFSNYRPKPVGWKNGTISPAIRRRIPKIFPHSIKETPLESSCDRRIKCVCPPEWAAIFLNIICHTIFMFTKTFFKKTHRTFKCFSKI